MAKVRVLQLVIALLCLRPLSGLLGSSVLTTRYCLHCDSQPVPYDAFSSRMPALCMLRKLSVRGGGKEVQGSSRRLLAHKEEVIEPLPSLSPLRSPPIAVQPAPFPPWAVNVVVGIIFIGTFIAYFERQGFSIVMADVARRAGLSESAKGVVLSAYYYGYTLMQIPGSAVTSRLGPTKVLVTSFVIWAALAFLTPTSAASGLRGMIVVRCLMGLAQGVMFPAWHNILATVVPSTDRGKVPLASSGMFIGSAVAVAYLPTLVEVAGAGTELKLMGGLGLMWALLWATIGGRITARRKRFGFGLGKDGRETEDKGGAAADKALARNLGGGQEGEKKEVAAKSTRKTIPWVGLLSSRPVQATIFGNMGFSYTFYSLLNWLPTYFESYLGRSLRSLGTFGAVFPYFCMFAMTNVGARLGKSVLQTAAGKNMPQPALVARKVCNTTGFCMSLLGVTMMPYASSVLQGLLWTAVSLSGIGIAMSGWGVNHMDIAPGYAGPVIALSNTLGAAIGIIATSSFGAIIDANGGPTKLTGWVLSFGLNGLALIVSIVSFELWARTEGLY